VDCIILWQLSAQYPRLGWGARVACGDAGDSDSTWDVAVAPSWHVTVGSMPTLQRADKVWGSVNLLSRGLVESNNTSMVMLQSQALAGQLEGAGVEVHFTSARDSMMPWPRQLLLRENRPVTMTINRLSKLD
jgi:hypothetical protein